MCIGDSLHSMPPWTGNGGNSAIQDTMDVADFFEKAEYGLNGGFSRKEIHETE